MIRRRLVLPVLGLTALLGAAGCTSGSAPRGPHSSSAPSTAADNAAAGALANRMQHALAGPGSAHVALVSTVTGERLTGGGVLALRDGEVVGADVTDQLPAKLGTIRLVRAGGTDYAELPAGLAKGSKPWVALDPHSSDPVTAQLAGIASPVLSVTAPATLVALVRSSPALHDQGAVRVGTVAAHRYAVDVDPAHLPAGVPSAIAGGSGGHRTIELAVDGSGRPVQVAGTITVAGLAVAANVRLSDYGAPVSIAAPPAGQVAH